MQTKKMVAALFLAVSLTTVMAENGFNAAKQDGFFYYKDPKDESVKKQPKKKIKPAAEQPQAKSASEPRVVERVIVQQATPEEKKKTLEPFSVEWLREKLPILRDRAINNPTYENVRAYRYAERLALDMSSNFTNMSKKVTDTDPMLNEAVRMPIATAARTQALFQIERAKTEIIKNISRKVGLMMFFDSTCAFCHAQYSTMKLLAKEYPDFTIRYVTTNGKIIEGMQGKFWNDRGGARARELGIQITPAVVMVIPEQNKFAIVAHGAMALEELQQKIVTAAIDNGLVSNDLTNLVKLQERGIIKPEDITQMRQQYADTDDPQKLVEMINGAVRKNMTNF